VVFIDRGRVVFQCSMDELESRYAELTVNPENVSAARALKPMNERERFGRSVLLFGDADRKQLAALGDVRTPSVEDLFVAVVGSRAGQTQGAAV